MAPTQPPKSSKSEDLIRIINACDSFPYPPTAAYKAAIGESWRFALLTDYTPKCPNDSLQTVGVITNTTLSAMPWTPSFHLNRTTRTVSIPFTPHLSESEIIASLLALARQSATFKVLLGWRDELYPIHHLSGREVVIERAAACLFGVMARGVHCTAFMRYPAMRSSTPAPASGSSESSEPSTRPRPNKSAHIKIIVPRRAATKATYPGMRDNSIAGGISVSETPRTALVREAFEECSLPGAVAARATGAGCVSYISVRNEAAGGEIGLVQPEVQFCFDLELFPRFAPPGGSDAGSDGDGGGYGVDEEVPRVNDDEVAGFECLSVAEVWGCLVRGEFKPNAAFVLVDFLLRRGFIGVGGGDGSVEKEKEKDDDADGRFEIPGEVYAEVVSRLHRRICLDEF